jgi:alkylhydroperoxidase/carboxymuconolactone decarboxylase family protein YurZ
MSEHLPDVYSAFRDNHPEIAASQDVLAAAVATAGPLNERELRLVKLAIAVGALAEGAVRSNARRALAAGATVEEVEQVALCAITTRGFPAAIAALGWISEVVAPGEH